jgi:hypothetical protein
VTTQSLDQSFTATTGDRLGVLHVHIAIQQLDSSPRSFHTRVSWSTRSASCPRKRSRCRSRPCHSSRQYLGVSLCSFVRIPDSSTGGESEVFLEEAALRTQLGLVVRKVHSSDQAVLTIPQAESKGFLCTLHGSLSDRPFKAPVSRQQPRRADRKGATSRLIRTNQLFWTLQILNYRLAGDVSRFVSFIEPSVAGKSCRVRRVDVTRLPLMTV